MTQDLFLIEPKISRSWAMPNHDTFSIKPVGEFVRKHMKHPSADPFARNVSLASVTNDLNPETTAQCHMDAEDFLSVLRERGEQFETVLFDPPYSPRQISECYKGVGRTVTTKDTQSARLYSECRDIIKDLVVTGGVVLSFGWNSVGMGKGRGFALEEILLVCHGGAHNDTICLAERKVREVR